MPDGDILKDNDSVAGLLAIAFGNSFTSMAIVDRALGGSCARKLRAVLPERGLKGEKAVVTAVRYFVIILALFVGGYVVEREGRWEEYWEMGELCLRRRAGVPRDIGGSGRPSYIALLPCVAALDLCYNDIWTRQRRQRHDSDVNGDMPKPHCI